jgi:hypothetical protein
MTADERQLAAPREYDFGTVAAARYRGLSIGFAPILFVFIAQSKLTG